MKNNNINNKEKNQLIKKVILIFLIIILIAGFLIYNLNRNSGVYQFESTKPSYLPNIVDKPINIYISEINDTYIKANISVFCNENEFDRLDINTGKVFDIIKYEDSLKSKITINAANFLNFSKDGQFVNLPLPPHYEFIDVVIPFIQDVSYFPFSKNIHNISFELSKKDTANYSHNLNFPLIYIPNKVTIMGQTSKYRINKIDNKIYVRNIDDFKHKNDFLNHAPTFYNISLYNPLYLILMIVLPIVFLYIIAFVIQIRVLKSMHNNYEVYGMLMTIIFGIFSIKSFYSEIIHTASILDIIIVILLLWSLFIVLLTFLIKNKSNQGL